jgi:hypothetical protein
MEQNIQLQKPKSKKRKIITAIVFIIIFLAVVYLGWTQYSAWWQVRKEYVRMGFAEDKFPYRMYTERELVEKGLWSGESPALNAVPTRTTPEETYTIFRQALIDGDLDKAAECFIKAKQEAWRSSLYEIKNKGFLQEMLNDLPDKLGDTYFYTDDITGKNTENRDLNHIAISSYYYVSKNDPEKMAKTMTFSKDWNGDWKIEKL